MLPKSLLMYYRDFHREVGAVINTTGRSLSIYYYNIQTISFISTSLCNASQHKHINSRKFSALIEHGFTSAPTQYRLYGRQQIATIHSHQE